MKKQVIILMSVFAILMSACIYSDLGVYNAEPIAGDPPTISVTTNLDTLTNPTVVDSLEVIYEIGIENGELYFVDALVKDIPVHESDTTHGSFWIYSNVLTEPGPDTLYLNIYYSTNSNSLADIIDFESALLELKYPIWIDKGGTK